MLRISEFPHHVSENTSAWEQHQGTGFLEIILELCLPLLSRAKDSLWSGFLPSTQKSQFPLLHFGFFPWVTTQQILSPGGRIGHPSNPSSWISRQLFCRADTARRFIWSSWPKPSLSTILSLGAGQKANSAVCSRFQGQLSTLGTPRKEEWWKALSPETLPPKFLLIIFSLLSWIPGRSNNIVCFYYLQ